MYLVEDHLKPSESITSIAKAEDYYNEMEFELYNNMME
jgi:hypothetical protein